MIDLNASKTALKNLFRRTPVAQIGALYRALQTHARSSVMRRLKSVGYFSSYTHAGSYYTLRDIPRFDRFGLWHYGNVGFCRAGTLKAAVKELVDKSDAGRTHQELQALLRVQAFNALRDQVIASRISRKALDKREGLYLSADASRATKQWARRQAQKERTAALHGPLTAVMTVEVLVEVLRSSRPRVLVTSEQVVRRLHHQGITVPLAHVQWVFDRYDLGKKGGPDSTR
jgi:hypothetical protein